MTHVTFNRDLIHFVTQEFDINADQLEAKIEKGFEMLMSVDTFLREFQPVEE